MKLTVVGGGSYTWTHTLVADLCLCENVSGGDLVLYDVNQKHLDDVTPVMARISRELGGKFKVTGTTDRVEALSGADLVTVTISTGGLKAMRNDLEIPGKYGIWQSVGDTTGPGGLSRAWRNVPVFVDLARAMERYCPDAWMLNLTNPLTVLTQSVLKTSSIKTVGLCHEIYHTLQRVGRLLGTENWREDFQVRCVGVNHFLWITELTFRGRDGFAMLREAIDDAEGLAAVDNFGNGIEASDIGTKISMGEAHKLKFELFRRYSALPACGDRHTAEFLPYVLTDQRNKGLDWGVKLTTVDHRLDMLDRGKAEMAKMASGEKDIPRKPSIESFAQIVAALTGGPKLVDVLNRPNIGQMTNMPAGAVVEGQVLITKDRIDPVVYGEVPAPLQAMLSPAAIRQEMIVQACIDRDEELALEALLVDPLVKDYHDAEAMWRELVAANAPYIPQFD